MKVAHVVVIPILSGAQTISLDILSGINSPSGDLDKTIICGEIIDLEFVKAFKDKNIKIISLPTMRRNIGLHDFKCFLKLYCLFKKNKYDIVHTNSTKPGIIARIAAKCAGTKNVIHTVHGIAYHAHTGLLTRCLYYCLENISTLFGDANITVNKNYLKFYPLVKSKVIYNGVDFKKLNPSIKKESKEMHFAFLGRLDEQKNPLDFIRAAHIVIGKYKGDLNIKFSIGVDGELRKKCYEMISNLELNSHVKMLGWITNKDDFFNSISVLCQPSKWEAFGLVFVEAAYYSVPAIATGVEGIPEVVLDRKTGLLYNGGAENLAECMLAYLTDPMKVSEYGAEAKKYAVEKFSKERMIAEYSAVYFTNK